MKKYVVIITCGPKTIEFIMESSEAPRHSQVADKVMNTPALSSQLGGPGLCSFCIVSVKEQH
ncbi:hypothetical protein [Aeromonas rivipollensis]|uniref:hypothetical protein n=1 Tax=Aeromonas rivipollensis TaxID=948519 RepID=UPI001F47432E|nr:hypothetical protein [Aeromonas rivipollensis]MCE9957871.1 hypothetical protein [Aeromonas rivipollensis]